MSNKRRTKVTVKVPATTANLGAGYDCMGMAVDLWNELTVEIASAFSIHIEGEGASEIPRNQDNYVVKGVELAFEVAGKPVPPLAYYCFNGIPYGSGLGSSSAAIVSGLMAGLVLAGKELQVQGQEELLQLAASIEGHIDNLSPCIYGGIQIGVHDGTRWTTTNVQVPVEMQCVVFTPSTPMSTHEARSMLPDKVPRDDAIFNIGRAALLGFAFASNRLDLLKLACQDAMHQPIRGRPEIMPALFPVIDAALSAGALGAFLSGAGSSIMALSSGMRGDVYTQHHSERNDREIANAMKAAAKRVGVEGRVFITKPSAVSAHVVSVTEVVEHDKSLGEGMRYISTRASPDATSVTFEEAVMNGLAPDGGLYVPEEVPKIDFAKLNEWRRLSFPDLAVEVMSKFIGHHEIPTGALAALVKRSYSTFSSQHVTPLIEMSDDGSVYLLEQFHGPTCAFKDVALQFVGNLFDFFLQRRNARPGAQENPDTITVLGATSGDTGSAAIEGLRGKENVEVFILHPHKRVAPIQEAQMTTILDDNVHNVAVDGSFDDCQAMVKDLFNDPAFRAKHHLAAINSINWARILAQIVYYFYAYFRYLDAQEAGELKEDADPPKIYVCVPTGNFGNALAGFYARTMGLPIERLVIATNHNDIIYRFMAKGDYSARPVRPSLAPAMDIVVPSNFERFLFVLVNHDPKRLKALMTKIKSEGVLDLGDGKDQAMDVVRSIFLAGRASDEEIERSIADYKKERNYMLCPHTAAGIHVMRGLCTAVTPKLPWICFATAHPGKFGDALDECRSYLPGVPPQLEGLLQREKRCEHIKHDINELRSLMNAHQAERSQSSGAGGMGSLEKLHRIVPYIAAFGAGLAVAHLLTLKAK